MTARNAAAERSAAAWLAVVTACILLAGLGLVAQDLRGADGTADEGVTEYEPEDEDADPAAPDEGEPGQVVEDAETSPDPATDAPPEDASAAPDEEEGAEAADAADGADGAALWGRWFRITEVREGDEAAEPVGDVPYLVGFAQEEGQDPERGALRWGGPCGTFAAEVAVAPEQLLVGEVSGGAGDCDDERHAQDAAVTQLLAQSPAWSIEDGRLVLRSQDRALVLVEDPDVTPPPAP